MRFLVCVGLAACGGGSGSVEGEPLIQSSLTAMFNNVPWTPVYGFARTEQTMSGMQFEFYVGDSKISCADSFKDVPRAGEYATLAIPDPPAMGNFTNVLFNLVEVKSSKDFTAKAASGSVMVTGVTEMDISAVFSYSATFDNGAYALTGAVTMLRCP